MTKELEKIKAKLIAEAKSKGITENFGQKDVAKLTDKYGNISQIIEFDNWCMNFDLSQL